jgi:hypothetical protein
MVTWIVGGAIGVLFWHVVTRGTRDLGDVVASKTVQADPDSDKATRASVSLMPNPHEAPVLTATFLPVGGSSMYDGQQRSMPTSQTTMNIRPAPEGGA